jgi:ribonuclease J
MNMMALRCGDDIIVVDAGMMFPGDELHGVDSVVPDITYLLDNAEHVRALVLTHGHEDHIGATAYVLSQLDIPVYATAFTVGMVKRRLSEHDFEHDPVIHRVAPKEKVKVGCFEIEFIQVTHSTVDTVSLAITTPLGVVIHTGDFKIDQSPIDGRLFDLHTFAEYGKRGVLLLLSDSTNVDRPGFTPSERAVAPRLEDVIARAPNAVFFTCFSSSVHRVQQIIDYSARFKRKVALVGRSMQAANEIAHDLGLLRVPDGVLVRPGDLAKLPRSQRTVIVAGSQGEPLSALSRAAVGKHKHVVIEADDTVAVSARQIPGNEKAIFRMIDHLCRRGANVLYGAMNPPIHVSGHACEEELRLMLNLLRPKYFVPVHGEYRQLARHITLAEPLRAVGLEDSFLLQSGEVLEIDAKGARRGQSVQVGRVCIDTGTGDEILGELVIRDRRHISEFGVIMPIVAINGHTGELESNPEIVTRGFVVPEDGDELLDGARAVVAKTLDSSSDEEKIDRGVMEEKIRADLRRYISRQTSSRPLIIPVILEV